MRFVNRISTVFVLIGTIGWLGRPDAAAAQSSKLYDGSLIFHAFGNDGTTLSQRIFTAVPLGAFCNPAKSGGMTCDPKATLQVGTPLTGSGTATLSGSSPAMIMLPAKQLERTGTGSLPLRYPYQTWARTFANAVNDSGSFRAGGGPGSYSRVWSLPTGYGHTRVAISPGKNQFGGVMRLLQKQQFVGTFSGGALGARLYGKSPYLPGKYAISYPTFGATLIGGGTLSGAAVPASDTIKESVFRPNGAIYQFNALAIGWPWTTGVVSVDAFGDAYYYNTLDFPERLRRTGYDNRTPKGLGTIQLVAPHLTLWLEGTLKQGRIAVLRLRFVPEPNGLLLLAAGAGVLGVLKRRTAADHALQESHRK